MEYEIRSIYRDSEGNHGDEEVIDSVDTLDEALFLLEEYSLCFGSSWELWIANYVE